MGEETPPLNKNKVIILSDVIVKEGGVTWCAVNTLSQSAPTDSTDQELVNKSRKDITWVVVDDEKAAENSSSTANVQPGSQLGRYIAVKANTDPATSKVRYDSLVKKNGFEWDVKMSAKSPNDRLPEDFGLSWSTPPSTAGTSKSYTVNLEQEFGVKVNRSNISSFNLKSPAYIGHGNDDIGIKWNSGKNNEASTPKSYNVDLEREFGVSANKTNISSFNFKSPAYSGNTSDDYGIKWCTSKSEPRTSRSYADLEKEFGALLIKYPSVTFPDHNRNVNEDVSNTRDECDDNNESSTVASNAPLDAPAVPFSEYNENLEQGTYDTGDRANINETETFIDDEYLDEPPIEPFDYRSYENDDYIRYDSYEPSSYESLANLDELSLKPIDLTSYRRRYEPCQTAYQTYLVNNFDIIEDNNGEARAKSKFRSNTGLNSANIDKSSLEPMDLTNYRRYDDVVDNMDFVRDNGDINEMDTSATNTEFGNENFDELPAEPVDLTSHRYHDNLVDDIGVIAAYDNQVDNIITDEGVRDKTETPARNVELNESIQHSVDLTSEPNESQYNDIGISINASKNNEQSTARMNVDLDESVDLTSDPNDTSEHTGDNDECNEPSTAQNNLNIDESSIESVDLTSPERNCDLWDDNETTENSNKNNELSPPQNRLDLDESSIESVDLTSPDWYKNDSDTTKEPNENNAPGFRRTNSDIDESVSLASPESKIDEEDNDTTKANNIKKLKKSTYVDSDESSIESVDLTSPAGRSEDDNDNTKDSNENNKNLDEDENSIESVDLTSSPEPIDNTEDKNEPSTSKSNMDESFSFESRSNESFVLSSPERKHLGDDNSISINDETDTLKSNESLEKESCVTTTNFEIEPVDLITQTSRSEAKDVRVSPDADKNNEAPCSFEKSLETSEKGAHSFESSAHSRNKGEKEFTNLDANKNNVPSASKSFGSLAEELGISDVKSPAPSFTMQSPPHNDNTSVNDKKKEPVTSTSCVSLAKEFGAAVIKCAIASVTMKTSACGDNTENDNNDVNKNGTNDGNNIESNIANNFGNNNGSNIDNSNSKNNGNNKGSDIDNNIVTDNINNGNNNRSNIVNMNIKNNSNNKSNNKGSNVDTNVVNKNINNNSNNNGSNMNNNIVNNIINDNVKKIPNNSEINTDASKIKDADTYKTWDANSNEIFNLGLKKTNALSVFKIPKCKTAQGNSEHQGDSKWYSDENNPPMAPSSDRPYIERLEKEFGFQLNYGYAAMPSDSNSYSCRNNVGGRFQRRNETVTSQTIGRYNEDASFKQKYTNEPQSTGKLCNSGKVPESGSKYVKKASQKVLKSCLFSGIARPKKRVTWHPSVKWNGKDGSPPREIEVNTFEESFPSNETVCSLYDIPLPSEPEPPKEKDFHTESGESSETTNITHKITNIGEKFGITQNPALQNSIKAMPVTQSSIKEKFKEGIQEAKPINDVTTKIRDENSEENYGIKFNSLGVEKPKDAQPSNKGVVKILKNKIIPRNAIKHFKTPPFGLNPLIISSLLNEGSVQKDANKKTDGNTNHGFGIKWYPPARAKSKNIPPYSTRAENESLLKDMSKSKVFVRPIDPNLVMQLSVKPDSKEKTCSESGSNITGNETLTSKCEKFNKDTGAKSDPSVWLKPKDSLSAIDAKLGNDNKIRSVVNFYKEIDIFAAEQPDETLVQEMPVKCRRPIRSKSQDTPPTWLDNIESDEETDKNKSFDDNKRQESIDEESGKDGGKSIIAKYNEMDIFGSMSSSNESLDENSTVKCNNKAGKDKNTLVNGNKNKRTGSANANKCTRRLRSKSQDAPLVYEEDNVEKDEIKPVKPKRKMSRHVSIDEEASDQCRPHITLRSQYKSPANRAKVGKDDNGRQRTQKQKEINVFKPKCNKPVRSKSQDTTPTNVKSEAERKLSNVLKNKTSGVSKLTQSRHLSIEDEGGTKCQQSALHTQCTHSSCSHKVSQDKNVHLNVRKFQEIDIFACIRSSDEDEVQSSNTTPVVPVRQADVGSKIPFDANINKTIDDSKPKGLNESLKGEKSGKCIRRARSKSQDAPPNSHGRFGGEKKTPIFLRSNKSVGNPEQEPNSAEALLPQSKESEFIGEPSSSDESLDEDSTTKLNPPVILKYYQTTISRIDNNGKIAPRDVKNNRIGHESADKNNVSNQQTLNYSYKNTIVCKDKLLAYLKEAKSNHDKDELRDTGHSNTQDSYIPEAENRDLPLDAIKSKALSNTFKPKRHRLLSVGDESDATLNPPHSLQPYNSNTWNNNGAEGDKQKPAAFSKSTQYSDNNLIDEFVKCYPPARSTSTDCHTYANKLIDNVQENTNKNKSIYPIKPKPRLESSENESNPQISTFPKNASNIDRNKATNFKSIATSGKSIPVVGSAFEKLPLLREKEGDDKNTCDVIDKAVNTQFSEEKLGEEFDGKCNLDGCDIKDMTIHKKALQYCNKKRLIKSPNKDKAFKSKQLYIRDLEKEFGIKWTFDDETLSNNRGTLPPENVNDSKQDCVETKHVKTYSNVKKLRPNAKEGLSNGTMEEECIIKWGPIHNEITVPLTDNTIPSNNEYNHTFAVIEKESPVRWNAEENIVSRHDFNPVSLNAEDREVNSNDDDNSITVIEEESDAEENIPSNDCDDSIIITKDTNASHCWNMGNIVVANGENSFTIIEKESAVRWNVGDNNTNPNQNIRTEYVDNEWEAVLKSGQNKPKFLNNPNVVQREAETHTTDLTTNQNDVLNINTFTVPTNNIIVVPDDSVNNRSNTSNNVLQNGIYQIPEPYYVMNTNTLEKDSQWGAVLISDVPATAEPVTSGLEDTMNNLNLVNSTTNTDDNINVNGEFLLYNNNAPQDKIANEVQWDAVPSNMIITSPCKDIIFVVNNSAYNGYHGSVPNSGAVMSDVFYSTGLGSDNIGQAAIVSEPIVGAEVFYDTNSDKDNSIPVFIEPSATVTSETVYDHNVNEEYDNQSEENTGSDILSKAMNSIDIEDNSVRDTTPASGSSNIIPPEINSTRDLRAYRKPQCKANDDSGPSAMFDMVYSTYVDANGTHYEYDPELEKKYGWETAATIIINTNAVPFKRLTTHYTCFYCEDSFLEFPELESHNSFKHPVDEFELVIAIQKQRTQKVKVNFANLDCALCAYVASDFMGLKVHLKLHHNKNIHLLNDGVFPYLINANEHCCAICSEDYQSYLLLTRHIHKHFTIFKCTDCRVSYATANRLKTHVKMCHERKMFACEHCDKEFKNQETKINHLQKVHMRKKMWKCPHCEESFIDYRQRANHLMKMHKYSTSECKCEVCGKNFKYYGQLRLHEEQAHSSLGRCDVCGVFHPVEEMSAHLKTHINERNFQCPLCGKRFVYKTSLNTHIRLHTTLKGTKMESGLSNPVE